DGNDTNNNNIQQQQQHYRRFQNVQFLLQTFIFIFWFIRGFIVLFLDDCSITATILGSIFNLLKIVRIYPELVAFHFAIKDFLCHFIIFGNYKRYRFYQYIISYCHQIYNPHLNDEQNIISLSERKLSPKTIFNLDQKELYRLILFIKQRFHGHCHIVCGTSILVGLTGNLVFFSVNPMDNHFYLFGHSYTLYSIYCLFYPCFCAIWSYYGFMWTSNLLTYFCIVCRILQAKSFKNELQIKNLKRFLTHRLRSHLSDQSDLFDEIRMLNEFWCSYLSITITVYIVLSCLSLYIITFTNVLLSMKIFFTVIFIQPVTIILLLTITSANLCFQIFRLNKRYYSILAMRQNNSGGRQNLRLKFKVMSTLELINSNTIGFTLNNQKIIDYKAIGMVIANTTTLFVLVGQNLRNN
ncbi:uncharacterized protein LOC113795700, partial [Dermatophagoides pteronyssinus]|uniref:uncharacterized protein LOC113795700 n=1 Tax=Dermatophagoides pteronyssinus TaxID=6956 RepID=UPI003F674321